jgi:hypothetical protein
MKQQIGLAILVCVLVAGLGASTTVAGAPDPAFVVSCTQDGLATASWSHVAVGEVDFFLYSFTTLENSPVELTAHPMARRGSVSASISVAPLTQANVDFYPSAGGPPITVIDTSCT